MALDWFRMRPLFGLSKDLTFQSWIIFGFALVISLVFFASSRCIICLSQNLGNFDYQDTNPVLVCVTICEIAFGLLTIWALAGVIHDRKMWILPWFPASAMVMFTLVVRFAFLLANSNDSWLVTNTFQFLVMVVFSYSIYGYYIEMPDLNVYNMDPDTVSNKV